MSAFKILNLKIRPFQCIWAFWENHTFIRRNGWKTTLEWIWETQTLNSEAVLAGTKVLTGHLCSSCFHSNSFGDTGDKGDWCWGPTRVRWGHWLAIHEFKEDFVNNQRPTALAEILLLGGVRLGLNSRGCCVSTPLETFLCPATFIHTCQLKVPKNSGLCYESK